MYSSSKQKISTEEATKAIIAVCKSVPVWPLALVTVVVSSEVKVHRLDEGRGAALGLVEVSHLLSLRNKDDR